MVECMGNIPIWCGDDKIPKTPYTVWSLCVLCWCIFIIFLTVRRIMKQSALFKDNPCNIAHNTSLRHLVLQIFIEVFLMEDRKEIYKEKKHNVGKFTLRNNVIIQNWSRCGYGGTLNIRYFTSVHTGQVSRNIHVLDFITKKLPISENGNL